MPHGVKWKLRLVDGWWWLGIVMGTEWFPIQRKGRKGTCFKI